MANRYWVGGTASWDGTAGTKWSATSGGAGGASVPTTADDVFFDASSTGTVTIATGNTGAKSINCTGFTGTLTGTAAISVAGSITLVAGMTYSHTGTATITGTSTLITAGKAFSALSIAGASITVTLGDALNISTRRLTVTQGTFDTANYNVTAGSILSSTSNTRTISLGSSTVTLSTATAALDFTNSTNLTLNAGTSQINLSSNAAELFGGGKTFYNVSFTSTSTTSSPNAVIDGANTFNNLTITAPATSGTRGVEFTANQTINGTLTCAGASVFRRCNIFSDLVGTARTITAAAISANDCDFGGITLAGAASGASPTRAGDCGNNSGITFPAARNVYRVGTNTSWSGSSSWAITSGGTGADTNFPLPQDTVIIDNNTTLTGTLDLEPFIVGTFNCSNRTTGITISFTAGCAWIGSVTLSSAITVSGGGIQYFRNLNTIDFTSAGKTIAFEIRLYGSGTFRLGDAFTSSNDIQHYRGTFDANNYNVTFATYFAQATATSLYTRVLTMGSGLWTLTGTGTVWTTPASNFTVNKNTANILLSDTSTTSRTFGPAGGGGYSYNKLTIGGSTGTSTLTFAGGSHSFTELASTKTVAHTITLSANLGTIGTWSVTGTPGNIVTVNSSSVGTQRTLALTNTTTGIDYLSVKDINETTGNKFYVGTNSTDGGNNTNVYFTASPAGGTGNMFMLLW